MGLVTDRILPVWVGAPSGSCRGGGDLHGLYLASSQASKLVVCGYPHSGVGAVFWQSGWGYILPVWPCPGVSSDGATVSPDPSCLSLQYLCCSSLCRGARVSLLYLEYFSCPIRI